MGTRPEIRRQLVDSRPWSVFGAEPAIHDGEEVWYSDPLVTVAGEAYPPRFRVALRCPNTETEVCVPVRVHEGGFTTADAPVRVNPSSCLAAHGKAIHGVVSGRTPPLAIIIARVPDSIKVQPDGTWAWVMAAWAWGLPPLSPERIARLEAEVSSEQRLRWKEQRKREVRRLSEVKRRMSEDWHGQVLPELRDIAELMRLRGFSRSALIYELQKTWSRSHVYEMVNLAVETGIIRFDERAEAPRQAVPLWNKQGAKLAPPAGDPASPILDIYSSEPHWGD